MSAPAVTVDRAGDVPREVPEILRGDRCRSLDQLRFDGGEFPRPLGCVRVRDHRRVPGGDVTGTERGRDLRQLLELARQIHMPARNAVRHVTRVPQRHRRVLKPVRLPSTGTVIRADLVQPRGFCRVECPTFCGDVIKQ